MRRFPRFNQVLTPFLICVLFFISKPVAAQKSGNPGAPGSAPSIGGRQSRTFTVSGNVSDAESNSTINGVRVELHSLTGATAATAFTNGNGDFQMNFVLPGAYFLVTAHSGYQPSQQRVDILSDYYGLQIMLSPIPTASGVSSGKATVSARELAIPHNAQIDLQKGLVLLNKKSDFQGSVKDFERAIHEYPDYYEAYTQMGVAYLKLGDTANAEQALRKALDMSQQHYGDALYWMALLLSNDQKFADAEPLARKAVELDANSWQANSELARALDGLGHPQEAETSALAAIKLNPADANLHLLLANIHIELQNAPALLDDLNAYLKLAPSGPFASQARKQRDQVRQQLQNSHALPTPPPGQ
jgi:tetratricopeptide (TPR) repeat protein